MGGKTWTLIGLEHIVCPPILGRKRQVRVQNPAMIRNESELRLTRTRAGRRRRRLPRPFCMPLMDLRRIGC